MPHLDVLENLSAASHAGGFRSETACRPKRNGRLATNQTFHRSLYQTSTIAGPHVPRNILHRHVGRRERQIFPLSPAHFFAVDNLAVVTVVTANRLSSDNHVHGRIHNPLQRLRTCHACRGYEKVTNSFNQIGDSDLFLTFNRMIDRKSTVMLGAVRNFLAKRIKKSGKKIKKSADNNAKPGDVPVLQYPLSSQGDRRVYVWGMAEHGGLGTTNRPQMDHGYRCLRAPRRLTFGERHNVTDIACGYGFTAFAVSATDKNIAYGTGINTDSQIGFHETDKTHTDDMIPIPRPINLPIENSSTRVLDLAAGRAHLLVLTDEGLYTLGNNGYGQCGRPIIQNENYKNSMVVHHIPNIKGKKIKAVTAGQDHSILLTESGEVYTFGWGADGQTGLAHYRNEYRPTLVKGDLAGQHIIKVASMADCVLALSDKGKVFGWGNAEYAQLPVQNGTHQVNIATELEACQGLGHIVDIAAGGTFCMILSNTGHVYVWGYGLLGLGPKVDNVVKPTLIPPTLFGQNIYDPNVKVTSICCGMSHMAAVTNNGDLYTWGCNKFGALGLGHNKDQYFPLKVSLGAQVKKVSCGIDHMITLCKPFV